METNNIGKLIHKLRKEKELTQQELGNLLGVSSKTISKWETGNGLPDITILKKISNELGITIEELLDGTIKKKPKKDNHILQRNILYVLILLIIILSILIANTILKKIESLEENNCTVIKTYDVKNIGYSNDGNYSYITITEYQVEGVYTIKLPLSISENIQSGESYVFTLKTQKENINSTTDILFEKSEIINLKKTDKTGMERENISYCDKEGD